MQGNLSIPPLCFGSPEKVSSIDKPFNGAVGKSGSRSGGSCSPPALNTKVVTMSFMAHPGVDDSIQRFLSVPPDVDLDMLGDIHDAHFGKLGIAHK